MTRSSVASTHASYCSGVQPDSSTSRRQTSWLTMAHTPSRSAVGRRAPDDELERRRHVVPLPLAQRLQHLGDLVVGGRRLPEQLGDRRRAQLHRRDELSGGPDTRRSASLAHGEELGTLARAAPERRRPPRLRPPPPAAAPASTRSASTPSRAPRLRWPPPRASRWRPTRSPRTGRAPPAPPPASSARSAAPGAGTDTGADRWPWSSPTGAVPTQSSVEQADIRYKSVLQNGRQLGWDLCRELGECVDVQGALVGRLIGTSALPLGSDRIGSRVRACPSMSMAVRRRPSDRPSSTRSRP